MTPLSTNLPIRDTATGVCTFVTVEKPDDSYSQIFAFGIQGRLVGLVQKVEPLDSSGRALRIAILSLFSDHLKAVIHALATCVLLKKTSVPSPSRGGTKCTVSSVAYLVYRLRQEPIDISLALIPTFSYLLKAYELSQVLSSLSLENPWHPATTPRLLQWGSPTTYKSVFCGEYTWTRYSLSASRALVASSRSRTLGFISRALAIAILCF
nr:hypothetical protein Iba_chr09eCG10120 [Ipomoea batatas]